MTMKDTAFWLMIIAVMIGIFTMISSANWGTWSGIILVVILNFYGAVLLACGLLIFVLVERKVKR